MAKLVSKPREPHAVSTTNDTLASEATAGTPRFSASGALASIFGLLLILALVAGALLLTQQASSIPRSSEPTVSPNNQQSTSQSTSLNFRCSIVSSHPSVTLACFAHFN